MKRVLRLTAIAVATAVHAGCSSVSIDHALGDTNTFLVYTYDSVN